MKTTVIQACQHFMRPIVRFLLRNGVAWSDFQELSKGVYVEIARAEYGIQGRPTNNARVAMLTGLSRREVARVRKDHREGADTGRKTSKSRITEILTAWHTDDDFTDAGGAPGLLDRDDDEHGFAALLKRYAGDMPHIALMKEMLQAGVMEEAESGVFRVLARDYVHQVVSAESIVYLGNALHDHATTLEHNTDPDRKTPARFQRSATNHNVSVRAANRFLALTEERGLAFLQDIDEWLSKHEVSADESNNARGVRMGVGVYVYHDKLRKGRTP